MACLILDVFACGQVSSPHLYRLRGHLRSLINFERRCFEPNFSFSSSVAWFVQTFIFGFPSMNLLAAYVPPGSKPVRSHSYYKFVPLSGIIVNGLKYKKMKILV